MSYIFVEGRCDSLTRSDGTRVALLPKPYCKLCAEPIHPDYGGYGLCFNCHERKSSVDFVNLSRVYATSVYLKKSRGHIISQEILKCKTDFAYVDGLVEILEHTVTTMYPELKDYDLLVPALRGHSEEENHIAIIAEKLSEKVGIPMKDVLYKLEEYPPQKSLDSYEERLENCKDKIGCIEDVSGSIIVVDDVFASGSTLLNCSKALINKGALEVVGLVLGRTTAIDHLVYTNVLKEESEDD